MTRNNIARALELARENLMTRKEQNKKYYDRNAKEYDINENDLVLIKNQTKSHKYDNVYSGPYPVIKSDEVYVEVLKDGKRCKVHKNLIKKSTTEHENMIMKAFNILRNG